MTKLSDTYNEAVVHPWKGEKSARDLALTNMAPIAETDLSIVTHIYHPYLSREKIEGYAGKIATAIVKGQSNKLPFEQLAKLLTCEFDKLSKLKPRQYKYVEVVLVKPLLGMMNDAETSAEDGIPTLHKVISRPEEPVRTPDPTPSTTPKKIPELV